MFTHWLVRQINIETLNSEENFLTQIPGGEQSEPRRHVPSERGGAGRNPGGGLGGPGPPKNFW